MTSDERTLVIIPTYDERENLPTTAARVRSACPDADILVVDDASPDGTGALADELAAIDAQVHVLHRAGKEGLGRAYLAGFAWGLDHGFDVLVEMDADGSHQPEELPRLLRALTDADVVLGSRWVAGGEVLNWPTASSWTPSPLRSRPGSPSAGQEVEADPQPGAQHHPPAPGPSHRRCQHPGQRPEGLAGSKQHRDRESAGGTLDSPDRPGAGRARPNAAQPGRR